MSENEQTLGQRRVRASFNPSKNSAVDAIKRLTADLIDRCEVMKDRENAEKSRYATFAQTAYEAAAKWAVKAAKS